MNILIAVGFVLLGAALERTAKGLYLLWRRRRLRRLRRLGMGDRRIDRLNRDSANLHAKSNVRIPVQSRPAPTRIPGPGVPRERGEK